MPLILICGQPCSGKSTVATALKCCLEASGWPVVVVDDTSLHMDRNSSYKDSSSEKTTRGLLKSAVDKTISRSTVVILDSLNNIKGYRYELWCLARAAATKYCVVYCHVPLDTARLWNKERQTDKYSDTVFEDLVNRFETPDSRNRWDCPLFEMDPTKVEVGTFVTDVVAAVSDNAAPSQRQAKALTPTCATTNPALTETNLLYELDKAAQDVIRTVAASQTSTASVGGVSVIDFGPGTGHLSLKRYVPLAELRNHKRGFLKIATQVVAGKIKDSNSASRIFVEYLKDHLS